MKIELIGKTWEKDIRIYENTVSDDIGYPSTVELADGTLITVFLCNRRRGKTLRNYAAEVENRMIKQTAFSVIC